MAPNWQEQDQKSIDAIKAIGQINNLNTGKMWISEKFEYSINFKVKDI